MTYGLFKLRVSKKAEKLDFGALSENIRKALCSGKKFEPDKHDIFRFFVIPESIGFKYDIEQGHKVPRRVKKKSFAKADKVLVQSKTNSNEIQFLGMYPVSTEVTGQMNLDLEGEALFEFTIPKILKVKLIGKIKNLIKRKKHSVLAARTDDLAQWIFLKKWIDAGNQLKMKIFCSVPKSLQSDQRFLLCDAVVSQKGRTIESVRRQKIVFPS